MMPLGSVAARVPTRERGAALLTVLLLVAVLAVLAAHGLDRLANATKLSANSQQLAQARAYLIAAEGLGLQSADSIRAASPARTTNLGGWNGRELVVAVPGGQIIAAISDGGNCFNVNGVVQSQQGVLTPRPLVAEQFARLLIAQRVPAGDARAIAASLADWIDTDQIVSPGGAEDDYYRGLDNGYLAPNALIRDISELRLIKGMTGEIYRAIAPWLCALPDAEPAPVNINTLRPDQALLLAILGDQAPDFQRLGAFLAQRPEQGYPSLPEFWRQAPVAAIGAPLEAQGQVKMITRWFRADIRVALPPAEVEERALIDAGRSPARLVNRQWNPDD